MKQQKTKIIAMNNKEESIIMATQNTREEDKRRFKHKIIKSNSSFHTSINTMEVKSNGSDLDEDLKGIPPFILDLQNNQPTLNIMTSGDVSHGKSTLLYALSGEKTGKQSREIKNNMTIRLGYTSCKVWKCLKCPNPQCYFTTHSKVKNVNKIKCKHCGSSKNDVLLVRHLSFIDVPGHAHLMQTMVSAECVADAVIVVIDASKPCPGLQTKQHCDAMNMLGLIKPNQVLIAQNKIDLVGEAKACFNYEEIREFMTNYDDDVAYNTPIIPISAQSSINIDALCHAIINRLPKYSKRLLDDSKENASSNLKMNVIRSFDVNKSGKDLNSIDDIDKLIGGVIGGSVLNGNIRIGQMIEIRPGLIRKKKIDGKSSSFSFTAQPIATEVISLEYSNRKSKMGYPGGNVGIQTLIDPSLTKNDGICGHVVVDFDDPNPPPIFNKFIMTYCFLSNSNSKKKEKLLKFDETIRINIGSFKMKAKVTNKKAIKIGGFNGAEVELEAPICASVGDKVAISRKRKMAQNWSFVGGGIIWKTKNIFIKSDMQKRS